VCLGKQNLNIVTAKLHNFSRCRVRILGVRHRPSGARFYPNRDRSTLAWFCLRLNVISITTRLMSSGAGFTVTVDRKTLTAVKSKRR